MRAWSLIPVLPLLLIAGCDDGAPATNNSAASAPAGIAPGQWELAGEVTTFTTKDDGPTPAINTPVGTRATQSVCVGAGDRLPVDFFSGGNLVCTYGNYYLRGGRINAALNCTRAGLPGSVPISIDGTFADGTASFTRGLRTVLPGNGDVEITTRVTARRTGDCAPGAAAAPAGNAQ
jgi:hypothetical protein